MQSRWTLSFLFGGNEAFQFIQLRIRIGTGVEQLAKQANRIAPKGILDQFQSRSGNAVRPGFYRRINITAPIQAMGDPARFFQLLKGRKDRCIGQGFLAIQLRLDLMNSPLPPEQIQAQGVDPKGRNFLASMGIYLFRRETLLELLNADPSVTDFGKEIFPRSIKTHKVQAYLFDGYWEDLGTVKAYHDSHLALASENPPFDFHSPEGVIYTRMRFLPASRIIKADLKHCLVSDGCVINEGARLEECVVGVRSRIGAGASLHRTVIMGADRYENRDQMDADESAHVPFLGIGENTIIHNAIIDKDARIGRNVQITNRRGLVNHEEPNHVIRDGIVVIPKGAIIPDNTVI